MGKKLKILVSGAGGQLARCLETLSAASKHDFVFLDKTALNICDFDQVSGVFERYQPDFIINTAAYTQVDLAEKEPEKAFAVNAEGVKILAEACKKHEVALIHISTDYVFDGTSKTPYSENDTTRPQTVYGASKLKGESYIASSGLEHYYILRTSWLYSDFGKNFFTTMLRLAEEKKELRVVNDQQGCPTNAYDLAEAILHIIDADFYNPGIYNFCNCRITSWYHFAEAIMIAGQKTVKVISVSSEEFPTAATRPAYSAMQTSKFEDAFNFKIRTWEEALAALGASLRANA